MTIRVLDSNTLVVQTDNPGQLRAVFPQIKQVEVKGLTFCAVPFTLEAARILNNIGIKAPSPIRYHYDWPIAPPHSPRWYQIDTSEAMTLNPRFHCHNAPRTGKTLSTLWAADYLRKAGKIRRTLIVAPLSTLEDVWVNTIFCNFPLRTFAVLHGSRNKRHELLAKPHDFYIINHHGTQIIEEALAVRPDIDLVVVDECFPAGTKVLTPSGERSIETLQLGDSVLTSHGERPITHVFKRESPSLVRVHFEDGTYVDCTSEHPFATERGWTPAKQLSGTTCLRYADVQALRDHIYQENIQFETPRVLREGMFTRTLGNALRRLCLRCLRKRISRAERLLKSQSSEILREEVCAQGASNRCNRRHKNVRDLWNAFLCQASLSEVSSTTNLLLVLRKKMGVGQQRKNESSRREIGGYSESSGGYALEQRTPWSATAAVKRFFRGRDRAVQEKQGGKRDWHDQSRGSAGKSFAAWMGSQSSHIARWTDSRISDELQSGLWICRAASGDRGGRRKSQFIGATTTGQEKRREIEGVRVVSIEDLECRGLQRVWNLEVAGPHDYFAGGVLVHNCAELRNARAKTLWTPLNHVLNKQGHSRWCWGLTGTPTPTAPTDAFAQSKLVTPENYRGHFTSFKAETMYQLSQFKWMPRKGWENTVARVLKPAIRFERTVCTDTEPVDVWRRAELSAEQHKAYKELLQHAVADIRGGAVTAVNAGVLASKLTQVACGVVYDASGVPVRMDFGPRLAVLEELIEQNDEKVLVFVPFTGVLDALASELRKRWTVAVVDGSVSKNARDKIFREFRTSANPHVIICHPQCMAHGLDLTSASLAIWYAPHDKRTYQQAGARIDGSKQTVKQDIAHIYATPEEKRIYQVIKEQGRMQDLLLEIVKNGGG